MNYKAFQLNEESQKIIWVEVSPSSQNENPQETQSRAKKTSPKPQTFSKSMENVRSSAEVIINNLNKISNGKSPTEINLVFGIKLDPIIGAVISQKDSEINYKIKLVWKDRA